MKFIASSLCASFVLAMTAEAGQLSPQQQFNRSVDGMIANLNLPGAAAGSVMASPSRSNPDYFYHWIRDGALTMSTVDRLFDKSSQSGRTAEFENYLNNFLSFSKRNQETQTISGLGEPKFYADGSAFNEAWGRPQNDGPPLRALTLIRYARRLLDQGRPLPAGLYTSNLPADSVVKRDLEYTAYHWRDASFDLWEEVKGQNYYTLMVQKAAMVEGADLATRLGDLGAAGYYKEQAKAIATVIESHWSQDRGLYEALRNYASGINYKWSNIDSSVILALLHAHSDVNPVVFSSSRNLSTFQIIEDTFAAQYGINRIPGLGVAIGRYPEDVYDGVGFTGGNPWFLTTLGMAEYLYEVAAEIKREGGFVVDKINQKFFDHLDITGVQSDSGNIEVLEATVRSIIRKADGYVARAIFHSSDEGNMAEQMNRDTGFQQGAPDLTWSYSAYITSYLAGIRAKSIDP